MRHLFYLHNLPLPDKVAAQKKIKNKIPARLYIYFPYGEISKKCFTVWRNYFSIKSYSTFSAKMFQAPFILYNMVYCIPYMEVNVDFLPYMEVNVGKKKNMAK